MSLLSMLWANIFWTAAFFVVFYGIGALLLGVAWREDASKPEQVCLSTVVGVGAFSIILLGISQVGLYEPLPIAILLMVTGPISVLTIIRQQSSVRLCNPIEGVLRQDKWLAAPLLLISLVEFVRSWLPNIENDTYHYELPLIWLRHGSMHDTGATVYDGFTHAMHLVYGAGLAVGGDTAANKIALIAFVICLFGCVALARAAGWPRRVGLYAACALAAVHSFAAEASGGWVDIHVLMFAIGAGVFGVRWLRNDGTSDLVLFGAMLGMAGGTKQNGWLAAGCLIFAFSIAGVIQKGSRRSVEAWPWAMLAFMAVGGPWLYWSYQVTGNPVYPAFNSFFGAVGHGFSGWAEEATRRGLERNLFSYVTYPWRLSMDFSLLRGSWAYGIGPAMIAFAPLAVFYRQRGIAVLASALFLLAYLSAMFFFAPHMVRYLFPALAFAALLAGSAAYSLHVSHRVRGLRIAIILLLVMPVMLAASVEAGRLALGAAPQYLTGSISASDYRKGHHNYRGHALVIKANEILPEDAKALLMPVKGLGLERDYVSARRLLSTTLAESTLSNAEVLETMSAEGITHLLVRVPPKALALAALSKMPSETWEEQTAPPLPPGYTPQEVQSEIALTRQDTVSGNALLLLVLADNLRLVHAAENVDHGFIYELDVADSDVNRQ